MRISPSRRDFLRWTTLAGGGFALAGSRSLTWAATPPRSEVFLFKTDDRIAGVRRALAWGKLGNFAGQRVVIKPNCNSHHDPPGSTHISTLETVVTELKAQQAGEIVVADRSGMGDTATVMERKGFTALSQKLGFRLVVLDQLPAAEWETHLLPGGHWMRGVELPKLFRSGDPIVSLCCLKTHRAGGHFTMSLKNAVGMVARHSLRDSYNYMRELHSSPWQRDMIAEINTLYRPKLVIMDALEAFIDGGPAEGTRVEPHLILASTDRVALDAVGVALLRVHGSQDRVAQGKIFQQDQLRRAVELKLGVSSPEEIVLITPDEASQAVAQQVQTELAKG